ncbi:MAG: hypothetical protein AB7O21_05335 [Gammaproteobacteria bacterium]
MKLSISKGVALAVLAYAGGASAATEIELLQQRLAAMEKETAALRAELDLMKQAEPQQESKVAAIETRVAKVEQGGGAAVKGNRVFFRGGYPQLTDDRANGAFTDMMDVPGALAPIGLTSVKNSNDDGWYFGAGFDFLLSDNVFGLLPGTWALAELGLEFRDLGSEEVHLIGPVAECLLLNELGLGAGPVNCTGIEGEENLMMLTVSAAPKLKFNAGGKLRPWIIPAGLDLNVISPPSDSTNYLDIGVQFAGGLDYEILPGITLGADVRYHLSADLTDPDYSAAAVTAARNAGLSVDTDQSNDTWTAGISLGIGF